VAPKTKSIAELAAELKTKKKSLSKLRAQRGKIAARLAEVDREIASLTGKAAGGRKRRRKAAAPRRGKRPRKRATGKPLVEYIKAALAKSAQGMRVRDVAKAAKQAGYPTRSKDFYGMVATALRDPKLFTRVARGVYKLKG